jgi:hypothetical protein
MRRTIALMGSGLLGLSLAAWASNAAAQDETPQPVEPPAPAPAAQTTETTTQTTTQSQTTQYGSPQYQGSAQYPATPESLWKGVLPAPNKAFELRLGTGYTQGLGHIAPGMHVIDVAGAGISGTLDLDYRINPFLSVGGEAQYQEFTRENNNGARGLAMNIGVTGHMSPFRRIDPFFRLGSGYRILWDVNQLGSPNTTFYYNGFQFLAGQLGVDIRVDQGLAFAPVIGADLQAFFWQNGTTALSSGQLSSFVYAGVQARFDMGGTAPQTPIATNVR